MEMPRIQAKGINERPHSTEFAEDARLNVPSNEMMQGPWNVSVRKEKELFPLELCVWNLDTFPDISSNGNKIGWCHISNISR